MSRLSYTQFWNLVGENRVERVKFTEDKRSLLVTTKANAPGGVRTEKVRNREGGEGGIVGVRASSHHLTHSHPSTPSTPTPTHAHIHSHSHSQVGLPFDPELLDHLILHNVVIEASPSVAGTKFLYSLARIILPIGFAVYLQKLMYNIGQPGKSSEDVFAQARLERYQGELVVLGGELVVVVVVVEEYTC